MRHLWNFKQCSPADYWVILPQRWTKLPLKSMVIFIFLKFGMVNLFETLQTQTSFPKNFHGPLTMRMHCNWPTDHATDHSSIGLKRLTIQPVFNEVSLFTSSKETRGFDVTVPKNYISPFSKYLLAFTAPISYLLYSPDIPELNNQHMLSFKNIHSDEDRFLNLP